MDVNTRGGLFGPGGYGGGIFDGSQMGFGGLGQFEQAAAGVQGLGADESETATPPAWKVAVALGLTVAVVWTVVRWADSQAVGAR